MLVSQSRQSKQSHFKLKGLKEDGKYDLNATKPKYILGNNTMSMLNHPLSISDYADVLMFDHISVAEYPPSIPGHYIIF